MRVSAIVFVTLVWPAVSADLQAAEVEGRVMAVVVDKSELIVQDRVGKRWTLHLTADAKVLINNRPGQLMELGRGDLIHAIYDKDGPTFTARQIRAWQI